MGYDISLRRTEADMVVVLSDSEVNEYLAGGHHRHRHHHGHRHGHCGCGTPEQAPEYPAAGTPGADDDCATADEVISRHSRTIGVALVGNPNSGKTSLFNAISGGHEHVGNYSGVTVGAKSGHRYYRGYRFEVTDLPGTYALSAYTPEERYVRSHIAEKTPDVIINSVVASNLERNLYLTTELIDINPRMVVALNMYDELDSRGSELDYDNLGRMLGVPMVPVEARNGKGIEALLDTVIAVYENQDERVRHIHINMGPVIEEGLRRLKDDMSDYRGELPKAFPPRYYAMKMLEGDRQVEEQLRGSSRYPEWAEIRDREAKRIAEALGEDVETAFANQKYGFIQGALKETYTPGKREEASATKLIDTFVTHKLWGFPIFFFLMWLMFWCTFSLGAYPQEWIDTLVGWIGSGVDALLPAGPLRDLLGRRHHRRRGGGHRLPAQHHDPLPVHLVHGGFGLSGARRVHHGSRDAPHRPARQIVHPADHGLRLQRPGHHGLPDDREPKQQADNHTHNPLHVMQCTNTYLPPARRDVLRRRRQSW